MKTRLRAGGTLALLALALAGAGCQDITTIVIGAETVEITGGGGSVLLVGATRQLSTIVRGRGVTLEGRTASWSSSNPSVVSVDPSTGLVTAISGGTADITATVEDKTGTTAFVVENPAPTITSLSTTSVTAGAAGFNLTVNGTNFVAGTRVRVNGSDRTTGVTSATQLVATIPASDLTTVRTLQITAFTPAPGGGTSNTLSLNVTAAGNPAPVLFSVSPAGFPGDGGLTITLNGSNFVASSVARWNGNPRTTTFVSAAQLRVTLNPTDIATAGTGQISVFNPAPGGGTSGNQPFIVSCPAPTIAVPSSQNGTLSAALCVASFGEFFQLYRFSVSSAATVTIHLVSSAFDAYLELYDGNFNFITEDDDSGAGPNGTNARIVRSITPGDYYVAALSFFPGETGPYTLTISSAAADVSSADVDSNRYQLSSPPKDRVGEGVPRVPLRD